MTDPKHTGWRPHGFTFNATVPGSWNAIYAATASVPLGAGMSTLKVAAPRRRDAAVVDEIEILPRLTKGTRRNIAVNATDLLALQVAKA